MKSKKIGLCFGILIVLLILWAAIDDALTEAGINPIDYARITDVEYRAVVQDEPGSEGSVLITERLTFDVHAASRDNLFWELWRDLPEDYVDGVHVYYTVRSVKQILSDGSEVLYEESPRLYWDDYDYVSYNPKYGPGKWYHSEGPYDESDAQYECVFFYVDGLYREKVVFEIEYEMHNAALRYGDCSDLYLSLYSGSSIRHLNSFRAQILFPNADMPGEGNYRTFTYGTNSNEFPVTESATANPGYYTFSFQLDKEDLRFRPYNEYLEFDLVSYGEDSHIFTEYAPSNSYSFDDVLEEILEEQEAYADAPGHYRTAKRVVFIVCLLLGMLTVVYVFDRERHIRARYSFPAPATDYEYFREIPSDLDPHFAAFLVFSRHKQRKEDSDSYAALLLSLARKGYLSLYERPASLSSGVSAPADLVISLTPTLHKEPLTLCEQYYYDLLRRHMSGQSISMGTLRHRVSSDYENTNSFVENMKNSIVNIGVGNGYFQKADYAESRRQLHSSAIFLRVTGLLLLAPVNLISYQTRLNLAFGGFTLWGSLCLLSSLLLDFRARRYLLLSQTGADEYARWRGLYRFLRSDTLIHERDVLEVSVWERYLVYATAFGLSRKVIQAISIRCPEAVSSPVLNNGCRHHRRFRRYSRSFHSAVRSGRQTAHSVGHGYSGFGGGGFGYGGGGRGGGGGGGGH